MIAMAVAGDPALVVADEPTTALDVTVQAQVLDLIRRLRDDVGCSFLFITHDLGVAAQVADRIAVLYGGRVMEVAAAGQLLGAPAHPYSIGLLRSRLNMATERDRPLVTLPGEPPDPRDHPPGCPFAPRCSWHQPECDVEPPDLERHGSTEAACLRLDVVEADSHHPPHPAVWPRVEFPQSDAPMQVEGLHKSFRVRVGRKRERLEALRGIDLEVRPGESVALVGESGCGKSTLLRVVAGLLEADGGSMKLSGSAPPQMVFQDAGASLTPWLSVGEQVGERILQVRREERAKRTDEALRLVGLPSEVARAKPLQLSGGQRQRVALARAVVVAPPLLLCDEPTSSLDVSLAAVVLNLIGRLRRELGLSVLFVTHDLAAARIVADRIAVMYLGQIVEFGPAEDVAASPAHPYTKALVAAVPDVGAQRAPVKGEPASPFNPPSGCPYHPRCVEALDVCRTEIQTLTTFGPNGIRAAACVHVRGTDGGR
jgi:peptide/nickel transport system ATP-binding protein